MEIERTFKIILVGDGEVGKTTWVHRLITSDFRNEYIYTAGTDVHPLRFQTSDGRTIVFNIWDCAGDERYRGIGDAYYISADGAILMGDLSRRETCSSLGGWKQKIERCVENIPFIVCGNKTDREDREVALDEDAEQDGIEFCAISVANGQNLEKPLLLLARKLLEDEDIEFA